MIAIVTGGTGFIATRLTDALIQDGSEVRSLSRKVHQHAGARCLVMDFEKPSLGLDDSVFDNVDVVYHLAGATRAAAPSDFHRANATYTHRLIDRILATPSRPRFIYISSQAAAGPSDNLSTEHRALSTEQSTDHRSPSTTRTESDLPAPIDAYGRSKFAAEEIVAERAGDMAYAILRPSAVYGPGDRDFLTIFSMIKRGVAIYPGTQHSALTTIYVDDLVAGILAAARSPNTIGKTYFLGADTTTWWNEIYHLVAKIMGRRIHLELDLPIALVQAAGATGDLFGRLTGKIPLVNSDKAAMAAPRQWTCSSQLAHKDFGFTAPTSLRDGLTTTYNWYRAEKWL